jgi:tryptophan halogenase
MKIVIVGGGTAGWLAALFFKKINGKDRTVVVVDSSKIGPLGAGEASTGLMTDIVHNRLWDFGCDENEFFRETASTLKVAILHQDWKSVGESFFGPIDESPTASYEHDLIQLHAMANNIPIHRTTQNGYLAEKNKSTFFKKEIADSEFNKNFPIASGPGFHSHAYNFDAVKVGKYFKKVCTNAGVIHLDEEVVDVSLAEDGSIANIKTKSGTIIDGDFFVDASGFKKLIFKDVLNIPWKNYKQYLPVDRAMPFLIPHTDDREIPVYMKAWAQQNGWMWQTPTQDRLGCGYVYSSEFTTDEQAQEEIETVLGHKINPIKILKYDSGRFEKLWHKNALVIGLAAAFSEPLEATSIQSTIVQLWNFCQGVLDKKDILDPAVVEDYNSKMCKMYDDYSDFINAHYVGGRTDSEFWKYMSLDEAKTPFVKDLLEICKTRVPTFSDFNNYFGSAGAPLYNIILFGLGKIDPNVAAQELLKLNASHAAEAAWKPQDQMMTIVREKCIDNNMFIRQFMNRETKL